MFSYTRAPRSSQAQKEFPVVHDLSTQFTTSVPPARRPETPRTCRSERHVRVGFESGRAADREPQAR